MNEVNLTVRQSSWRNEDMAIICGIANAGGGILLVSTAVRGFRTGSRKLQKTFESLPSMTLKELGISCSAEPVMDGTELCLGVVIPGAQTPISYQGKFYLYSDGSNKQVSESDLDQRPKKKTAPVPDSKKFAEYSFAAANNLDLTSTDEFVIKALEMNGRASAKRIAGVIGVSESTVRRSFRKLKELKIIERIGSDKAGYWKLHI